MKNPFGNYVIQKTLKLSSGYYKSKLTGIIKNHIEKLNDRKLINKWKDILSSVTGNTLSLAHLNINKLSSTHLSPNNSFVSGNSPRSPHSPHSFQSSNSMYSNTSMNSLGYAQHQPPLMNKYVFMKNSHNLNTLNFNLQGNMSNSISNMSNIGNMSSMGSTAFPNKNDIYDVNYPNGWNISEKPY